MSTSPRWLSRSRSLSRVSLSIALLLLATSIGCTNDATPTPTPARRGAQLHVTAGTIVDDQEQPVRLRGVNRSGAEFHCVHGDDIWDGPVDAKSIDAMLTWKVGVVRIPLNEDCWLGIHQTHPAASGEPYRQAIRSFVADLGSRGIVVILDLHWSNGLWTGEGTQCAMATAECQKPMPNAEYSPAFWASVAETFRGDLSVVFDLFNEPFPNATGVMSRGQSWQCWLAGGSACPGLTYQAAGMQQLVDAIRATGSRNLILASGNAYANDLTQWMSHQPRDPVGNIGAAWHSYDYDSCGTPTCWATQFDAIGGKVPVVVLEFGQSDCARGYVDPLMDWLDARGASYLGWTWNTWDCRTGPALITAYDGTPTAYGEALKSRLEAS